MDGPRFLSTPVRGLTAFAGVPTAASLARDPAIRSPVLLHLNECPFPPSPKVVEAICRAASGVNRYGDPRPDDLAATLAARTGITPGNIVIGNGSDEILGLVSLMALRAGDSAVMPTPSFPRYRLGAKMMGADARLVRNLADGRNDVAGILRAIDASTKVVYACTPNNPSGAPLAAEELEALAQDVPQDVLLVMDEAYYEFDAAQGGTGALEALAQRRGPWLSTRTLSKAYALAGMRIGYGLASSAALADGLVRVKLNFNLSSLSVIAAQAALADEAYAQACIRKTIAERNRVAEKIEDMGYATMPSRANFVSFDSRTHAAPLITRMAEQAVFVREWRDPGFETYVRMTIGLPEENDRTLQVLAEAMAPAR
ncbi:MAG: histidinol-phosphate transaminase [Burkholderiaceae bacterium]